MGIKGDEIFDLAKNVGGGTQYLAMCLNMFKGDTRLALAGYNAGPEAVKKHGGVPPYKETRNYVTKVLGCRGDYVGGVSQARLAEAQRAKKSKPAPEPVKRPYTICFHSGLTQPAEEVLDDDKYYYVKFEGRNYRIKKHHVREVIGPA